MASLVREVDRAIAEENRRFLADPKAIAEARADGERFRLQMEAEGILPPMHPRSTWLERMPRRWPAKDMTGWGP